jgi:WS/DGAT/MGAT family acyltransferase
MKVWLRPERESREVAAPQSWKARPAPTRTQLFADEVRRRSDQARSLLSGLSKVTEEPQRTLHTLKEAASSVLSTVGTGVIPVSKTPLNPERIGAYRRIAFHRLPLDEAREITAKLGGTVNDVLLATIAGGIREYLLRHEVRPDLLDFRVMMPTSLRSGHEQDAMGNRVSAMVARLPLEEGDPVQRLRRVTEATQKAKRSRQSQGGELVGELGNWTTSAVVSQAIRLGSKMRPFSLAVTNIPGPPIPLYMRGARLLEAYASIPLYHNQALAIALFSYAGELFWGLTGDWDALPDLEQLVADFDAEFARLQGAIA